MPKLINKIFCRGLLLALMVLPLTWPGLAKANGIPVPDVTLWEWESDKVGCAGGAFCTWTNTLFISANVAPSIFDYEPETDIFADLSLRAPDGTLAISNAIIPLDFTSEDFLGYLDFSADVTITAQNSSSFQIGTWVGFGIVCLGSVLDGYCESPSTPQSASFKVPEPTILALFGLGLAGLGFARRKKV